MKKFQTGSLKSRLLMALWWLVPVIFAWSILGVLAHQTTQLGITWTRNLFGWTLLLTYVCIWGMVIASFPNARLIFIRAIAVNLTLVIIIICLEVAAGLKMIHWRLLFENIAGEGSEYITSFRMDPELGFGRPASAHWSGRPPSDIELGYSMPASLSKPITFTYDQWGYRNPFKLEKADVVLVGDSYIEGAYVSDDQTVASLLNTYLGKPVANLGIAGYGSLQELIVLKRDALRYKPRIVIWFFFEGNDLYDDHEFDNAKLAKTRVINNEPDQLLDINEAQGWRKRSFTKALIHRLRLFSEPLLPTNAPYFGSLTGFGSAHETVYFADYANVPWSEWLMTRWETTTSTLKEAKIFAEQQGIEILFCLIPIKFRVYQPFIEYSKWSPMGSWTIWPLRELFSEACDSAGLVCIDLTEVFQDAVRTGGMPYSAVDTHWSPKGNDLVASVLADELCQRGWLGRCVVRLGEKSNIDDKLE